MQNHNIYCFNEKQKNFAACALDTLTAEKETIQERGNLLKAEHPWLPWSDLCSNSVATSIICNFILLHATTIRYSKSHATFAA